MSAGTGPTRFAVIRDAVLLGLGAGGIAFQQLTGRSNAELLAVYLTLLGLPGATALVVLVRGRPERTTPELPPTAEPSPRPPDRSSSSS